MRFRGKSMKKIIAVIAVLLVVAAAVVVIFKVKQPDVGVTDVTASSSDLQTTEAPETVAVISENASDGAVKCCDYYLDGVIPQDTEEYYSADGIPGVTFRWTANSVTAVSDEGENIIFNGMPVWNLYFCDLTGDGVPEICSCSSLGSGMINELISVYDYTSGDYYELNDRCMFDYSLLIRDGKLCAEKRFYSLENGFSDTGELHIREGRLVIDSETENGMLFGMIEKDGALPAGEMSKTVESFEKLPTGTAGLNSEISLYKAVFSCLSEKETTDLTRYYLIYSEEDAEGNTAVMPVGCYGEEDISRFESDEYTEQYGNAFTAAAVVLYGEFKA